MKYHVSSRKGLWKCINTEKKKDREEYVGEECDEKPTNLIPAL